jgi:tripartite-type tricarboxylate transporter receptor subunit TctC
LANSTGILTWRAGSLGKTEDGVPQTQIARPRSDQQARWIRLPLSVLLCRATADPDALEKLAGDTMNRHPPCLPHAVSRRSLVSAAACLAALSSLAPGLAGAQAFPSKPIRLVVAYSTGGSIDLAARRLAEQLGAELGQSVVVENRGGANGIPASEYVANSPADGHTILFTTLPAHAGNRWAYKKLPYDTLNSFTPVTVMSVVPLVLVATPSLPVSNVAELAKLQRGRSKPINYASFGIGGMAHLAGVQMNLLGRTEMNHVPYKGGGAAMADVLAGHVDLYFAGVASALPLIKDGKLKALAVTSTTRVRSLPDVPTVAETPGYENFEAAVSPIMLVPAKTPAAVVSRIQAAMTKVVGTEAYRAKLDAAGEGEPRATTPEESKAMLTKELTRLGDLMKAAGIEPE